jgi:hypothetical protein
VGVNDDGDDPAQGIEAVRTAALDSVRHHLRMFDTSMAYEDLWENHPLLIEREAEQAQDLAAYVANQLHETLTEAAVVMFTQRIPNDQSPYPGP